MHLSKSARNTLLTLARVSLLTLGFGFTCLGAFLSTIKAGGAAKTASAYVCIVLGFVLLIAGVFWAIFLTLRTKLFLHARRQARRHRDNHIITVDRPDFYPPSYEESSRGADATDAEWVADAEPRYNIAPPLYTASVAEVPSEDYSSEDPPPYSETVVQAGGRADDPPAGPAPGDTPPGAPVDGH